MTIRPFGILVSTGMQNTKPYIQAASVCEKILIEPDGVASLIRLVDVFHLDLDSVPIVEGVPPAVEFSIIIALKSGSVAGKFTMGLRMIRPDGKAEQAHQVQVELHGGGHGSNLRVNGLIANPTYGLHWFDVLWQDEILTRIPLELKPKQAESQTPKK